MSGSCQVEVAAKALKDAVENEKACAALATKMSEQSSRADDEHHAAISATRLARVKLLELCGDDARRFR